MTFYAPESKIDPAIFSNNSDINKVIMSDNLR